MTEKQRPAFDAYVVDGDGKAAFWSKIGAAWPHEDGKGYNIQLTAIPVNGRIALRLPREKSAKAEDKATPAKPEKAGA